MLTSVMDTNEKVRGNIEQCKRMGIKILPPDINASVTVFSVDGEGIRFGMAAAKNVGEAAINVIVKERDRKGKFTSLADFCSRIDSRTMNRRGIESLIKCGAFDSFGAKRSQLLSVLDQALDLAAVSQKDKSTGMAGLFVGEALEE